MTVDQTPLSSEEEAAQVRTLLQLGAIVVGLPVLALVWLGWLEVATLRDGLRGNHITAVLRMALARQPGAFGLLVLWISFLVGLAAYVAGHAFWGIGG